MTGVKELVAAARAGIENLSPSEVAGELASGKVLLLDLREPAEAESGMIHGAVLAPRGMLEYYADPSTPYYMQGFEPDRRIILYCASGGRSALGAKTLQDLGYRNVAHLDGGIKAWREEGLPLGDGTG